MILGFALAVILNKGVYAKNALRATVFMPYVSNIVAVAVISKVLLGSNSPIIQQLQSWGFEPPLLLQDLKLALPTTAVIAVWERSWSEHGCLSGRIAGRSGRALRQRRLTALRSGERIRHVYS